MLILNLLKISITTRKKLNLLLFFQATLVFILVCISFGLLEQTSLNVSDLKGAIKNVYKINDNFIGDAEKQFFAQPDNVDTLKSFYNWLSTNPNFDYIIANKQNVEINSSILPSIFEVGYDNGQETPSILKSLQINNKFIEHFNLAVSDGRLLDKEDYYIKNTIPILLGSDYKKYFKLHERLELYYLSMNLKCEVVGFLNEGSYYYNSYDLKYLDRYIILPSFEIPVSPKTNEEKSFNLKLYLDKCSGFLSSNSSPNYLQKIITEKCYEMDIIPYAIEGARSFYPTVLGLEGERLQKLFFVFVITISISSVVCISISSATKIQILKKDYALFIVNGMKMQNIFIAVVAEIILLNFIALLLAIAWNQLLGAVLPTVQLFAFYCVTTLTSVLFPYKLLASLNLSKTLRGDV